LKILYIKQLDIAPPVVPKINKLRQLLFKIYQVKLPVTAASEQHKLSKNEVIEKVISVADF